MQDEDPSDRNTTSLGKFSSPLPGCRVFSRCNHPWEDFRGRPTKLFPKSLMGLCPWKELEMTTCLCMADRSCLVTTSQGRTTSQGKLFGDHHSGAGGVWRCFSRGPNNPGAARGSASTRVRERPPPKLRIQSVLKHWVTDIRSNIRRVNGFYSAKY